MEDMKHIYHLYHKIEMPNIYQTTLCLIKLQFGFKS